LAASAESVDIRRRLTVAHPAVHEPDLATSLNNYSTSLLQAARTAEALAAADEATSIRRALFAAYPETFRSFLASALVNRAEALRKAERPVDAVHSVREAVGLYREVAAAGNEAAGAQLATALHVMAGALQDSFRTREALAAAEECVRLQREIATDSSLADGLVTLGLAFVGVRRQQDARAVVEEALGLYEHLQRAAPPLAQISEGLARARTVRAAIPAETGEPPSADTMADPLT
jgi:tetratricopeptide (TPR) repeat protein